MHVIKVHRMQLLPYNQLSDVVEETLRVECSRWKTRSETREIMEIVSAAKSFSGKFVIQMYLQIRILAVLAFVLSSSLSNAL
jgi:hypothetical protein